MHGPEERHAVFRRLRGSRAEHGFRFFPGFYRHLPDTMNRIPSGQGSVLDRLVGTDELLIAELAGAQSSFLLRILKRLKT